MANPFVVIAVAASAMKAYGTLYQGYAMAAYYKGKADLALLQGRTKKVEAKETGVDKLRELNEVLGTNIARNGAGGTNPFTGSNAILNFVVRKRAGEDFRQTQLTQDIVEAFSIAEAQMLNNAARTAKKGAIISAVADIGLTAGNIGMQGGFGDKYKL
tara:strand:- start:140 stop:613 length:474 start_codon:yes stop_codon:yes gene_type:complete